VGTGFSSDEDPLDNMEDVTTEFVYFMKQMQEAFP